VLLAPLSSCARWALGRTQSDSTTSFATLRHRSTCVSACLRVCVRRCAHGSLDSTLARERYFAELLQSIYSRHSSVLLMMARSAYELRGMMKVCFFCVCV
jgi:hypothetical protein